MSYLDDQRGTGGYFPDEPQPSGPISNELTGVVLVRKRANHGGWVGYQSDESAQADVTQAQRDILIFDACLSATHTRESKITDHPVEKGAAFSEHIQPQPRRLQMEVVSSAVMRDPFHGMGQNRDIEMWNLFEEMWASQELFYVATNSQDYSNMAIETLSRSEDTKTGQKVVAKVAFKEIIQVEPQFVEFPRELLKEDVRPSACVPVVCPVTPEGGEPGSSGSDVDDETLVVPPAGPGLLKGALGDIGDMGGYLWGKIVGDK